MPHKVTATVSGKEIHIETGKLAKQADGAVTVQLGETIIVVAAVAATKAKPGQDFFPLTVDYRERAAAAGKFPGGYFKREGRPTEKEILTCRLTDRPIRPLFAKGWYNEVQVQSILLSTDGENDPDILNIIGASAALMVSDIPWDGPLGACRVGRVNGQFIANPTHAEAAESDLDLVYVGNAKGEVVMYEGSAKEITEEDFVKALAFAQTACEPIIKAQQELTTAAGKQKRQITTNIVPEEILTEAKNLAGDKITAALLTTGKLLREGAVKAVTDEVSKKLVEKFGAEKVTEFVLKDAFYYIQKEAVRKLIMKDGKRLDGRAMDAVRPITSEVSVLPRAHGSALFQRGETQSITLVTMGTGEDVQEFDAYTGGETTKKFLLHYNFPNFSVGETGRISGPGRREIGHGALAERSIEPMLPLADYPYAVRVTSEIMESNGSTSMASVCGGTLALLDAGVPMTRPVGGISVGICTNYNGENISEYKLLTDIIGWEDAFCDMDCKLAGTDKGITGFQLDLKLKGIPSKIMEEALQQAKVARLHVLAEMAKTISEPRKEMSKYAPRIITVKINPEKIGMLIGPGGKNIKRLVDESGCEINIEDDGTVRIFSTSPDGMEIARREIEGMTAEAEAGKIYRGKVVTLKEFGAFVEFLPGRDGLVHISEWASFRVKHMEDVAKVGDEVSVKCLGVDEKGRVRLSRKAAMEERDQDAAAKEKAEYEAKHGPDTGGDHGGERRESRGGDRERGPRPGGDRGGRGGGGRGDFRGGGGGGRDRGPRPEFRGSGEHRGGGEHRPPSGEQRPEGGEPREPREPRPLD
ncbi:MAG TPA: polyribonucleotide nucleotidyltransferase [Verrucomicrobiae bacterium]